MTREWDADKPSTIIPSQWAGQGAQRVLAMMEENGVDIEVVEIKKEPIELHKLLKLGNLVPSGGEAKYVIAEGLVAVNGVVEFRKGKKIFSGDIVEFQGARIQIVATGLTPS
jgi:ribosome-associated protein